MNSVSQSFRFVSVLCLLTIINMMFFGITWKRKNVAFPCSGDAVLQGVARYIRQNGKTSFADELTEPCKTPVPSNTVHDFFKDSLQHVVRHCQTTLQKKPAKKQTTRTTPILTLFTSWSNSSDEAKETVHRNTLRNWSKLSPRVRCFVFTNDSGVVNITRKYGMRTLPILQEAGGGAPVLKAMFTAIQKVYPGTPLYGYANSDILFTDRFVDTLELTLSKFGTTEKPLLMTGQRTNVDNVSPEDSTNSNTLEVLARTRGLLFSNNAEDYFITNPAFPWETIADVVIGRLAYDNWLVGHARCKLNATVVDLTETVLAVHQTTSKGGNFEGFKHAQSHYNTGLFKKMGLAPVYEQGFTDCAEFLSHYTMCGDMNVSQRTQFATLCSCKKVHS